MIFDELWKAQRERKKIGRLYHPDISKAAKEKRWDDHGRLISEFGFDIQSVDDKIEWIETRRLQERAEKYGIPIPPLSDKESWGQGFEPGTVRLTREARIRISEQVRKERRARMDDRMLWANHLGPVFSPLTGLIGTTIGLIAFLRSCG